jgi:hypothetical protein
MDNSNTLIQEHKTQAQPRVEKIRLVDKRKSHSRDGNQNRANQNKGFHKQLSNMSSNSSSRYDSTKKRNNLRSQYVLFIHPLYHNSLAQNSYLWVKTPHVKRGCLAHLNGCNIPTCITQQPSINQWVDMPFTISLLPKEGNQPMQEAAHPPNLSDHAKTSLPNTLR